MRDLRQAVGTEERLAVNDDERGTANAPGDGLSTFSFQAFPEQRAGQRIVQGIPIRARRAGQVKHQDVYKRQRRGA